jgi:hypothetical protein
MLMTAVVDEARALGLGEVQWQTPTGSTTGWGQGRGKSDATSGRSAEVRFPGREITGPVPPCRSTDQNAANVLLNSSGCWSMLLQVGCAEEAGPPGQGWSRVADHMDSHANCLPAAKSVSF